MTDDLIEVGHILGVHGVKGQVKVFSSTSPRENIVAYGPWVIKYDGSSQSVKVSGRRQGKNVIANIEGITTREQALELTGSKILIHSDQLPVLAEGDFYWKQLIGLEVRTTHDESLGCIKEMMETGANDVIVVKGDRERLIPYIMTDVVKSIDLDSNQMIVEWDSEF